MDSAERAFVAHGFDVASLEQITRDAGLTRGAFYANFADKGQLLAAVAERVFARHATALDAVDVRAPAQTWFRAIPRRGPWFALCLEAVRAGIDEPTVRDRIEAAWGLLSAAVERLVERAIAAHQLRPLLPARDLAAVLVAVRIGVLVERELTADPLAPGTYPLVVAQLLGLVEGGGREASPGPAVPPTAG